MMPHFYSYFVLPAVFAQTVTYRATRLYRVFGHVGETVDDVGENVGDVGENVGDVGETLGDTKTMILKKLPVLNATGCDGQGRVG